MQKDISEVQRLSENIRRVEMELTKLSKECRKGDKKTSDQYLSWASMLNTDLKKILKFVGTLRKSS